MITSTISPVLVDVSAPELAPPMAWYLTRSPGYKSRVELHQVGSKTAKDIPCIEGPSLSVTGGRGIKQGLREVVERWLGS